MEFNLIDSVYKKVHEKNRQRMIPLIFAASQRTYLANARLYRFKKR
jgi:hypothetical protein